jgi:hypothetical protein
MRKRIYVVLLYVLGILIASTAFIPLNKKHIEKEKVNADIAKIHPEAGYIEEIGN